MVWHSEVDWVYDHHLIGDVLQDIRFSLVGTSLLGGARSKKQLLNPMLNLSIELWQKLHAC